MTSTPPTDTTSRAFVAVVLRKALGSGTLPRIPRHPDHRDVVLAVLCLAMRRRHAYTEGEMNRLLERELAKLKARVDHVTVRRYLVDLGFVKRDRAGRRYILNYPRVESALSPEAMASAAELIETALNKPGGGKPRRTRS